MCARYTVFTEEEIISIREIINEVSRKFGDGAVSTGEVRPTNRAAVLVWENGVVAPISAKWGFPKWNGPGGVINARAETVAEKPMFRDAFRSRRCVVPSTGYCEWRHVGGTQKEKYYLTEPGKDMLYMAGIIDAFRSDDGEPYDAFTVLTTDANESVSPLHDRMPLILREDELEAWMGDEAFAKSVLEREGPVLVLTLAEEIVQTTLF